MVRTLLFLSLFFTSIAQAELQVFPLRVQIDEKNKAAYISLRNRGKSSQKYRISAVFYEMQQDGNMILIEQPSSKQNFLGSSLRYSPKVATLEPNVEQVVRLMARFPSNSSQSELRAHLHFEPIDSPPAKSETKSKNSAMKLTARLAIAIPIILRKKKSESKITLSGLKVFKTQGGKLMFEAAIEKLEDDVSVYGDFELTHTERSGHTISLATINGVSSYIKKRVMQFPINFDKITAGKLTLVMKSSGNTDGEAAVLATIEADQPSAI